MYSKRWTPLPCGPPLTAEHVVGGRQNTRFVVSPPLLGQNSKHVDFTAMCVWICSRMTCRRPRFFFQRRKRSHLFRFRVARRLSTVQCKHLFGYQTPHLTWNNKSSSHYDPGQTYPAVDLSRPLQEGTPHQGPAASISRKFAERQPAVLEKEVGLFTTLSATCRILAASCQAP